jgi:hypothetical protein
VFEMPASAALSTRPLLCGKEAGPLAQTYTFGLATVYW